MALPFVDGGEQVVASNVEVAPMVGELVAVHTLLLAVHVVVVAVEEMV